MRNVFNVKSLPGLLANYALVLSGFFLVQCTPKNTNEILIGHFASLTGTEATFGQSTEKGIRLAVDEINAAGGIKGKKIKLITMDNRSQAEETNAVVNRLIEQEKVIALLGEVASQRSKVGALVAQPKKIPMITPSSTNPDVTAIGDYIFRVCFIDPFQGTVMAKFAFDNLKVKRVAILREIGSDYSVGLADFFSKKFKELGGEIVTDLSYSNQDVDYKAQLTQIKSKKPEAIFIPGYYSQVGLIARQAKELGLSVPLMGGDGWDSPKLSEIGKTAVNGSYFSNHYSNDSDDPVIKDFIKRFKAKYNEMPDGLSSVAYDAAQILALAMEKTSELNSKNIRDQLALIKDFHGVTGKISIDKDRNAQKPAVVVKVDGATNKFVTTVNP